MASIVRIEAKPALVIVSYVSCRVCEEELMLLTCDQSIANVFDVAKDIRQMFPRTLLRG
jgi:hypothetical protein